MNHLLQKLHRDLFGILFFALGLFLSLSLGSFNPQDPSLNSISRSLKATNFCGIVGSFTADLLFQALGLSAWLLTLFFFHKAILCFKDEKTQFFSMGALWGASLVVLCSTMLATYFPQSGFYGGQIQVGGLMGAAVSKTLLAAFNNVGLQLLLWSLTAALTLFYSEKNIREIYKIFLKAKPVKWPSLKSNIKNVNVEKKAVQRESIFSLKQRFSAKTSSEKEPLPSVLSEGIAGSNTTFELKEESSVESLAGNRTPGKRRVFPKVSMPKKVEHWEMPKLSLLEDPPETRIRVDEKEMRRKADILVDKLRQFNVEGQIVAIKPGPAVTLFEFKPNADVKINEITKLNDDLALALSSESLRIIAPIPGRDVVGIETSNSQRETVYMKDLLAEESFWSEDFKLPMALGRQANGDPKIVDLRKMPHLLVAGTTGSGKSVFTVANITGLLFRHSPKTLRLILVDPKQVDLAAFGQIPHLLMPPVTDPKKAVVALKWAVREMEKRYRSMKKFGARGIEGFNEVVGAMKADQLADHEKINLAYEGKMKLEQYYYTPQPYIVIIVEEFGDLMSVDKQNVEQTVVRLAQMARACGIHLILAMQSPRKEVVTGLIKTNIPGRISFKVASKMDSRIILDEGGAERLLAQGDMLYLSPGLSKPLRHHGPFLKESEINGVAQFWTNQAPPVFDELAVRALEGGAGEGGSDGESSFGEFGADAEEYDEKYDDILSWASEQKEVSASLIQRRFRLGYPRAARLIEIFEREGVVGPANGSKPRQVLVQSMKDI